jgi:hypothetical protein
MVEMSWFVGVLVAVLSFASVAQAADPKWKCEAKGLAESDYRGGKTATIRLDKYARGGDYAVTKSADGKTANGTTADGTPFTCTPAQ